MEESDLSDLFPVPPTQTYSSELPPQLRHLINDNRGSRNGASNKEGHGTSNRAAHGSGGSPRIGRGFCTRQRVKGTPSLSTCNHFEILSNICDFETNLLDVQKLKETFTPPSVPVLALLTPKVQKPKWERALPESYTILAIGESSSLKLKVKLETTDTSERKSINSLVDSGATGEFIN